MQLIKYSLGVFVQTNLGGGGVNSTEPSSPGFDSQHSEKNFRGKIINVIEVN